ncbi:MAG: cytidylate kinase-like family protein [Gammaproteobacteria bacterium]|jgi:cytidylate kinase
MKCNVERMIEALIASEVAAERKAAEDRAKAERRATYVVTISRGYGSLGKQVGQALADKLGVRCCDRIILQEVARRADVDTRLVEALDERIRHIKGDWWKYLFSEKTYVQERYLKHLVKVILNISEKGGVIIGRGAHLILGPARCFRVRITGTPEKCAARIAEREEIDLEAASRRITQVNKERAEYIRRLYNVEIGDDSHYDIVLNTDRFNIKQCLALILHGMQLAGYKLTPELGQAASA